MIKKIIALCLSIPFIFCGCGYEGKEGDVSNVKIHEFSSELYTEEDVNAAADEIKDFFKEYFYDCTLNELYYAGDEECNKEKQYRSEKEYEYMVLLSSFYVGKHFDGTLGTDCTYNDYEWLLYRKEGGDWVHFDQGYC